MATINTTIRIVFDKRAEPRTGIKQQLPFDHPKVQAALRQAFDVHDDEIIGAIVVDEEGLTAQFIHR